MSLFNEHTAPSSRPVWWSSTTGLLRRAWLYLRENDFSGLDGLEL